MTREEKIELMCRTWWKGFNSRWDEQPEPAKAFGRSAMAAILNAIEPIIREDLLTCVCGATLRRLCQEQCGQ